MGPVHEPASVWRTGRHAASAGHLGGCPSWWRDLGNPAMTEALKDGVVQGVAEARGMCREEELERTRAKLLTDLIREGPGSLF